MTIRYSFTAICVQAETANIFSRLFTFRTPRLQFKRRVGRWKRDCYRSAYAAAILGVTVMFWHGKLHNLVI